MYKYRAIESLPNGEYREHRITHSEDIAKTDAKRIVAETHHICFVERFDGEKWERGSIRYWWLYNRVCFYNHR